MLKMININDLQSGDNCRNEKDETLKELEDSINMYGLIQPLAVRKKGSKYVIVAGHRRFECLKRLNYDFVECNVMEECDSKNSFAIQLSENVQRKQMSAYELCMNFDQLKEKYNMNNKQLAKYLGVKEQWISDNYHALKVIDAVYGDRNGIIPEDAKKKTAGEILAAKRKKMNETRKKTIILNGGTVKYSGHSYMIYCSDYSLEKDLLEFIEKRK